MGVLQQIAAVRGAVNGLMAHMLEGHILQHLGDLLPPHRSARRTWRRWPRHCAPTSNKPGTGTGVKTAPEGRPILRPSDGCRPWRQSGPCFLRPSFAPPSFWAFSRPSARLPSTCTCRRCPTSGAAWARRSAPCSGA
ncbi:metal-sensing transcriptional repressor [Acidovorax sp. NCPPB 3576]|uniref:metal-sensing transcriptional repressor n=1 Tax=Acidovorax sp. NCPPB 3576 TaxID=2940488 RepID=UPI002349DA9B|nr:metal-sensing transcriptional repressor [Acidovorax sp. NCPPB 3576]WCM90042.1 metal-sensing transcriptional repressor [Acidovorax sp. NCPPB 3576]